MNLNFTLFAATAVFVAFIVFTAKFIWPPLLRAIDERRKKIADGLAAAERGARSLDDARAQSVQMHAQARGEAQALVADSERRAREIIDEARLQAKVEADQIVVLGRAEAAQAMQQAKAQLRGEVAVLAVAGARQILQREVDARAHAALLDDLKARL